jgi:hypothetical protein
MFNRYESRSKKTIVFFRMWGRSLSQVGNIFLLSLRGCTKINNQRLPKVQGTPAQDPFRSSDTEKQGLNKIIALKYLEIVLFHSTFFHTSFCAADHSCAAAGIVVRTKIIPFTKNNDNLKYTFIWFPLYDLRKKKLCLMKNIYCVLFRLKDVTISFLNSKK